MTTQPDGDDAIDASTQPSLPPVAVDFGDDPGRVVFPARERQSWPVKHVRLSMSANGREAEVHPMYDLMANAPFVDGAKTTHWNYSGDELGIMHYVEGDVGPFRDALDAMAAVHDYGLTTVDDGSFYAYLVCGTTERVRQLFGSLTRGSLVVHHPIRWTADGRSSVPVVGTAEEIQTAIDGIPEPVEVEVREIGGLANAAEAVEGLLSDRQREAVERALSMGYYEIPREATLEDVAAALDCGRSTAAEHLRKSEATLLHSIFQG